MTKVWFILGTFAFITFVVQMGALMGSSIVTNAPPPPTIPDVPTAWDYLTYPVANIGYFFQLMAVSSTYTVVGVILSIFLVGLIWAIIELIRGV
jgi:hypothetical protein